MTTTNPNPQTPTQTPNETKEAHTAFTTSLKTITSNHDAQLQSRTHNLHSNETALRAQEERLQKTTEEMGKMNEGFEGLAEEARRGLKEIGDVQNWAEMIERELVVLEEVVEGVEGEAGGEGGGMNGVGKGKGREEDGGGSGKRGWMPWW